VTLAESTVRPAPQAQPFRDPDPFQELRYPNAIAAKKAVARMLGIPLARLAADRIAALDALLAETLENEGALWLTLRDNGLTIIAKGSQTDGLAHDH
jgi:hypothetical protein